jgi:hypothetical protein
MRRRTQVLAVGAIAIGGLLVPPAMADDGDEQPDQAPWLCIGGNMLPGDLLDPCIGPLDAILAQLGLRPPPPS